MSLRVKLILALTLLAAAATATIGISSYRSTEHQLQSDIDNSLNDAARRLSESPDWGDADHDNDAHGPSDGRPRSFEQVLIQIVAPDGSVLVAPTSGELPVDEADRQVAASADPSPAAESAMYRSTCFGMTGNVSSASPTTATAAPVTVAVVVSDPPVSPVPVPVIVTAASALALMK